MTPDHWGFVVTAYGLAAVVLGGYWRRLVRLERDVATARDRRLAVSLSPHPPQGSR